MTHCSFCGIDNAQPIFENILVAKLLCCNGISVGTDLPGGVRSIARNVAALLDRSRFSPVLALLPLGMDIASIFEKSSTLVPSLIKVCGAAYKQLEDFARTQLRPGKPSLSQFRQVH